MSGGGLCRLTKVALGQILEGRLSVDGYIFMMWGLQFFSACGQEASFPLLSTPTAAACVPCMMRLPQARLPGARVCAGSLARTGPCCRG